MVQAILDGRKTMTRRVVKPQPSHFIVQKGATLGPSELHQPSIARPSDGENEILCPYGQVGDVLWVKETHWAFGEWKPNGTTKTGKQKWKFKRHIDVDVVFNKPGTVMPNSYRKPGWYKRPSLFMEQSMARIWLEITNVRVERVEDIRPVDCVREGIEEGIGEGKGRFKKYGVPDTAPFYARFPFSQPRDSFKSLWESINGSESWNSNPWVWVVEFKQIEKP